jgi:hypothetical protein
VKITNNFFICSEHSDRKLCVQVFLVKIAG